jgi:hypothetical protein
MTIHTHQSQPAQARSLFRRTLVQQALMAALAASACGAAQAANDWTGAVDRDWNNPGNWSAGVLPPQPGGNSAGIFNVSTGNTALLEGGSSANFEHGLYVGHGSGASGVVDIVVPADTNSELFAGYGDGGGQDPALAPLAVGADPRLRVGDAGGTGTLTMDVRSHTDSPPNMGRIPVYPSGLGVGLGAGSVGRVDALGAGKQPWEFGYTSPNAIAFRNTSTRTIVGGSGGSGQVRVDGAGLVFQTSYANPPAGSDPLRYLAVGEGSGSVGQIDVLGGGKFASDLAGNYGETSPAKAATYPYSFIGKDGGAGRVTVTAASDPANTRAQTGFNSGLRLGHQGGAGQLHILEGGKSLVSNGNMPSMAAGSCSTGQGHADFPAALQISDGAAASSGLVRVQGAGSELRVAGTISDDSPLTVSRDQVGQVRIGSAGALVAANGGVAKVGLARWEMPSPTPPDYRMYGVLSHLGGLGPIHVSGTGRVVYGAEGGSPGAPPGRIEARLIHLADADSQLVFNITGSMDYNLPLTGAGQIVQQAGETTLSATLAAPPSLDPSLWVLDATPACAPDLTAPTHQGGFAGKVDVQGGRLTLPASNLLPNLAATRVRSGGVLMQGGTWQTLGAVTLEAGGTLQLTAGATPAATDASAATQWTGGGGVVQMDTVLGADGSASDVLRISGAISGTTYLQINNLGGAGAATTDGILVVQADQANAANSFALQGGGPVQAGGFNYSLQQKGNNWYLVSGSGGGTLPVSVAVPVSSGAALLALGGLLAALGARVLRRPRKPGAA